MTDEQNTRRKRAIDKKARIPMGGLRQKLQLSDEDMRNFEKEGFVVRWINDQDGRLPSAVNGGWDFVTQEEAPSVGAAGLHQENTDLNSRVSKVVSRTSRSNQPIRAFLMKIPKEFYDEDQAAKEEVNRQVDRALRPTDQGGQSIEGGYTPR